jgi:hypothetical protein
MITIIVELFGVPAGRALIHDQQLPEPLTFFVSFEAFAGFVNSPSARDERTLTS